MIITLIEDKKLSFVELNQNKKEIIFEEFKTEFIKKYIPHFKGKWTPKDVENIKLILINKILNSKLAEDIL